MAEEKRTRAATDYATKLDEAEIITLGRTARWRSVEEELNRLLDGVPKRAQITQLFERAALAYAKMVEATDEEMRLRRLLDKQRADSNGNGQVTAEVEAVTAS